MNFHVGIFRRDIIVWIRSLHNTLVRGCNTVANDILPMTSPWQSQRHRYINLITTTISRGTTCESWLLDGALIKRSFRQISNYNWFILFTGRLYSRVDTSWEQSQRGSLVPILQYNWKSDYASERTYNRMA